jgi:putative flavoprotein involved in K+ transport
MDPTTSLDVLVIGAGQAGLALGQQLRQHDLRILLVDRNARIGDSWRQRFDLLTLFTPRAYSALPGLPLPGDPDGYPTKDEQADYLEAYAARFELPLALGTGIAALERLDGGFHAVTTLGDTITARAVVIATGAFQEPIVPAIASQLSPDVSQLTAATYRNPGDLPAGTVLVVGDGATGRQIALELSASRDVLLATGRPRRVSPDRILGRSVFWWMDKLGIARMSPESRIGSRVKAADPFPGKHLGLDRLRERGITIAGRLASLVGDRATFASGESIPVGAVVWATGYRDRTDWVRIHGAVDAAGAFAHDRGVSPVPGLFFIGRSWQTSRGSALVTGVGRDAAEIVSRIETALATSVSPAAIPEAGLIATGT